MRLFGMLAGPHIHRAPENDEGSDPDDLDEDFSLDEPEDEPDDEPDEDADLEEVDDQDADEEPAPKRSRGENRVAAATRTANEAKERADRLEREMADLRANLRPQTPQETPEQRQQRLQNMDPLDRLELQQRETDQRTNAMLQRIEFEAKDNSDRLSYDSLCQRQPAAAKLKEEVEKRLADMRKTGMTAPRETVLKYLIGERALANGGRASSRAKKGADQQRQRQEARPGGGRGDVAAEGRTNSSATARAKRMDSYQL